MHSDVNIEAGQMGSHCACTTGRNGLCHGRGKKEPGSMTYDPLMAAISILHVDGKTNALQFLSHNIYGCRFESCFGEQKNN